MNHWYYILTWSTSKSMPRHKPRSPTQQPSRWTPIWNRKWTTLRHWSAASLSSGSRAWVIIAASTYKRPKALNLNWEKAWQTLNLKNDILFSNFNILGAELRALLNMKAWAQLRLKKSSQILSLRQPALGYGKEGRGALRCKEVLSQITNGW